MMGVAKYDIVNVVTVSGPPDYSDVLEHGLVS